MAFILYQNGQLRCMRRAKDQSEFVMDDFDWLPSIGDLSGSRKMIRMVSTPC